MEGAETGATPAPRRTDSTARATLTGSTAIVMWSLLALLTNASGDVPPFQLLSMTFLIAGLAGVATWPLLGWPEGICNLPASVWITGVGGLFGYHFFYYTALRNAPAEQASLIAFLWPMLIVAGSALLPGEKLRWYHGAGVAAGFGGAAILLLGGTGNAAGGNILGYGSAFACAFTWSAYSILSRSQRAAPTAAVAYYCLATAGLSAICHLAFETTMWPASSVTWLAVLGLGLMPVGIAFYAWDHGVKHGDIQFLGTAAYFAPLLSTAILIAAGVAKPGSGLLAACVLIVLGALISSGRFAFRRGDAP
jgi:drug/metabolite transporter (DMT)-like permease